MNGLALCAGGGGLELGLRLAIGDTYRTRCYVEREAYAAAVLVARMEEGRVDSAPIWDDLTTFDGRRWRGSVDLVSAGFPCQPWSAAGEQGGFSDDRWIWPDIARIIGEVRPGWVFLENVPGLVRGGLCAVLCDLTALGFDAEWTTVRASDVGAPHKRERLFVLGMAHPSRAGYPAIGERQPIEGWAGTRPGRGELADASSDSVGGDTRAASKAQGTVSVRTGSQRARGLRDRSFPPGPGDTAAWSAILAERPELAPALESPLCRVADGMARGLEFRTQRLRLLGNGVVPQQAALAFRILAGRNVCSP